MIEDRQAKDAVMLTMNAIRNLGDTVTFEQREMLFSVLAFAVWGKFDPHGFSKMLVDFEKVGLDPEDKAMAKAVGAMMDAVLEAKGF